MIDSPERVEPVIIRFMSSALFDELETKVKELTSKEKAALARVLIDDLESAPDEEVDQLWIAEAQRRYDAYLTGELETVDGDAAMARARSRLR
jgi:uncharacterized protein YbcC (UPF0753/DUF2309 family)